MPLSSVVGAQSIVKPGVCTSSTRPASPFEGQMIYETDTDKVLVYNGSAWYANWNLPWGVVGYATPLSATFNTSSATPVDVTGMSISFTGIANRRYRVNFNASQIFGTSGDRVRLTFTGTNITPTKSYYFGVTASTVGIAGSYSHVFTATGSSVIKLQFCRDSGSSSAAIYADTAEGYGHFYLEDIGPA
jgi:hypothetical protein